MKPIITTTLSAESFSAASKVAKHSVVVDASVGQPSEIRWALTSLSLATLLSALGTSVANVALPTLVKTFDASFQQAQWVVVAYLLAVTTLIVSVGQLGDMVGRRRFLLGGLLMFTVASALCGFAPTLWLLIIARAVQGLGASIMMALTMAFVGEIVPPTRIGSAMGLLGTISAIGTGLGPSLGGVLIAKFGWPAIFFINIPLGFTALLLAHRFLPVERQTTTKTNWGGFDYWGTLLLILTLTSYALALTMGRGHFGWSNMALLVMGMISIGLFMLVETKTASPLLPWEKLRNPLLRAGLVMSTLVTTVVMATLVVGPFYLSGALGLNTARIGLVMSCGPVVAALVGVPAGHIIDRYGSMRMTVVGLIGMGTGAILLSILPVRCGVAGYLAPLMILTAGYALFQAANNTAVMTGIQSNQRGVISGLLNLSRNLGLITGITVMGSIFALGAATSNLLIARPEAIAAGMRITFLFATIFICVAFVIAVRVKR